MKSITFVILIALLSFGILIIYYINQQVFSGNNKMPPVSTLTLARPPATAPAKGAEPSPDPDPVPVPVPVPVPAPPIVPEKGRCSLEAGQYLYPDQYIQSSNNRFIVKFQSDGNLVLYERKPTGLFAEWASMTLGGPVGFCVMQSDGNLVIYAPRDPPSKAIWSTRTNGQKNVTATIRDDGNFVLYSHYGSSTAVWNAWANHPICLPQR